MSDINKSNNYCNVFYVKRDKTLREATEKVPSEVGVVNLDFHFGHSLSTGAAFNIWHVIQIFSWNDAWRRGHWSKHLTKFHQNRLKDINLLNMLINKTVRMAIEKVIIKSKYEKKVKRRLEFPKGGFEPSFFNTHFHYTENPYSVVPFRAYLFFYFASFPVSLFKKSLAIWRILPFPLFLVNPTAAAPMPAPASIDITVHFLFNWFTTSFCLWDIYSFHHFIGIHASCFFHIFG